jgi:hypothetical protein
MSNRERIDRIDPTQIDRLVDGELSERERSALLSRFDTEPHGWRRCALAFLEAQSWREELASLESESASETAGMANRVTSPPLRRASSRLSVFKWAAAVLVAFTLGWFVGLGSDWQRGRSGVDRIAERGAASDNSTGDLAGNAADMPAEPSREVTAEKDATGGEPDALGALLATVRFPDDGDGAEMQVPIYEGPDIDEAWLREQPPALPEYVKRQWERRGYKVSQQRWLYPFELEDGRQVVLPVDEVNVQFVGYEAL